MDQQMLNYQRHLHEAGSFQYQHLLDVVNLDVLQNPDELNPDADLPCQVVVHLLLVVLVDVERHQLRMDYFQDAVDVELRHLKRMDYFQAVALVLLALEQQEFLNQRSQHQLQVQLVALCCFRQSRALGQL